MSKLTYAEWHREEYRAAADALLPLRAVPNDAVAEFVERFRPLVEGHEILPVNRARTGLLLALRAFRDARPERCEIIVPGYICPSVIETIEAADLDIVPVDVGSDLNLDSDHVRSAISSRTLAVIAAHMYGCPANIGEIGETCRRAGVFVVDDAAQIAGVAEGGRALGTYGDVGLASFSQSKTIVTGAYYSGGLLIVNNPALAVPLRAAWQRLSEPPSPRWHLLRFLAIYQYERFTDAPLYFAGELLRHLGIDDALVPEHPSKMSPLTAAIALPQLTSLANRIAGRKRVARRFHEILAGEISFPQYAPDRFLTRVMVLLPDSVNMEAVRTMLRFAGVQTRTGYGFHQGIYGAIPAFAAKISKRILELPSHSQMEDAEIDQICASLMMSVASDAIVGEAMPGGSARRATGIATASH